MLGFGSRGDDVTGLIARRKYGQAIDVLTEQVREDDDPRARLQLADVLAMAGREAEAVPVLMRLADDLAATGNAAKAIALLKKVQRLDPSRVDVEERLATVIKQPRPAPPATGKGAAATQGYAPRQGADKLGYEPSGAVFGAEHFDPAVKYTEADRIAAARGASWVADTKEPAADEVPYYSAQLTSSAPEPPAAVVGDVSVEPEVLPEVVPEVLPEPEVLAAPDRGKEAEIAEAVASPLFSSLEQDELLAVIQGLRLLSYEPGDIVITQGDAGDSLFVVTGGCFKTFIHDPEAPRQLFVRLLEEGDFFGEISILSGRPRTATVTAAEPAELLQLDRATLDGICIRHPRVREVLEEFYVQRATTQAEAMQRAQQLGR